MIQANLKEENYLIRISGGIKEIIIDEPESNGGQGKGSTPTQHFLASLGGCVASTIRMYSDRKGWDPGEINVDLEVVRVNGKKKINKTIRFENQLEPEQVERLSYIAKRCPISLMISGETEIDTKIELV